MAEDDLVERAVECHGLALDALDEARVDDALALAAEAVDLFTTACGPDHPDTANARLAIAEAHQQAGRFVDALAAATAAAASLDAHAGCGLRDVEVLRVQARVAAGNLERIVGDLDVAWRRLADTVAIAERELGADDPETAGALNALGIVGKFAARFDEAEAAYRRSLAVLEALSPLDVDGIAGVLHNLGGLEHERGRPAAGIDWAERGLALRRTLGSDGPDVAADLGALGALYEQADRLDDAEDAYRRAMAIFESTLGSDHYEVGVVAGNLAMLLARRGDPTAAQALYRRALALKAAALGDDHPDLAVTLHNLGVLLADIGRRVEGIELVRRAEAVLAANLPPAHPRLAGVRATLRDLEHR